MIVALFELFSHVSQTCAVAVGWERLTELDFIIVELGEVYRNGGDRLRDERSRELDGRWCDGNDDPAGVCMIKSVISETKAKKNNMDVQRWVASSTNVADDATPSHHGRCRQ